MPDDPNDKNTSWAHWLGYRFEFNFNRAKPLGHIIGGLLAILALAIAILAIWTFVDFGKAVFNLPPYNADTSGASIRNIGLVLAALIGAPFLVWRTILAAQQTKLQDENLITDRINAAVASLGAEKQVSELLHNEDGTPRQDKNGNPATFTLTKPNLEVRIGAILALERLSVQNCTKDPDLHVQIMEIICAYIRENAPASTAIPGPVFRDEPTAIIEEDRLAEDGSEKPLYALWGILREQNRTISNDWKGSDGLKPIRTDIMTALEVISRRNPTQRAAEALARRKGDSYLFGDTLPPLDKGDEVKTYDDKATAYRTMLAAYPGYRPDLRRTNLQGAELVRFDLSGCNLTGSRLEGANLLGARLTGAVLRSADLSAANLDTAILTGCDAADAIFQLANLSHASCQAGNFTNAIFKFANLIVACFQAAELNSAHMQGSELAWSWCQGADLSLAELQGAFCGAARMQEVRLWRTNLSGAYLVEAELLKAFFREARISGCNLADADLRGVNFERVTLDENTSFKGSTLLGASFRFSKIIHVPQLDTHASQIFADSSLRLSESTHRPSYWRQKSPQRGAFRRQWRAWQANLPEGWEG